MGSSLGTGSGARGRGRPGEHSGLVKSSIERSTRFVDLAPLQEQPIDRGRVTGPLGFGLGGFVVVAAFAQLVVLELQEEPGDLVGQLAWLERARVGTGLRVQRPGERGRLVVDAG